MNTKTDPLASHNGREWPPTQREEVDHLTGCAALLGGRGPSGDRCDCGRWDYNERLDAYWDGYEDAVTAMRISEQGR